MVHSYAGKRCLLTGAASGIGLAAARRFAGLGMKVALADLAGSALARATAELTELAPGNVLAVATDVSQFAELQRLHTEVERSFGTARSSS